MKQFVHDLQLLAACGANKICFLKKELRAESPAGTWTARMGLPRELMGVRGTYDAAPLVSVLKNTSEGWSFETTPKYLKVSRSSGFEANLPKLGGELKIEGFSWGDAKKAMRVIEKEHRTALTECLRILQKVDSYSGELHFQKGNLFACNGIHLRRRDFVEFQRSFAFPLVVMGQKERIFNRIKGIALLEKGVVLYYGRMMVFHPKKPSELNFNRMVGKERVFLTENSPEFFEAYSRVVALTGTSTVNLFFRKGEPLVLESFGDGQIGRVIDEVKTIVAKRDVNIATIPKNFIEFCKTPGKIYTTADMKERLFLRTDTGYDLVATVRS